MAHQPNKRTHPPRARHPRHEIRIHGWLLPSVARRRFTASRSNGSGRYSRRMSDSTSIIGRWRITEMDNWDQESVDLVQAGFIEFDDDGLGGLGFIVVTGEVDCRDADRDGRPGVEFS